MRPPGYEPGELPTAPLRDINHCKSSTWKYLLSCFLVCECKGSMFFWFYQTFEHFFLSFAHLSGFCVVNLVD